MSTVYKVTVQLPADITAESRTRAGIIVHRVYGYTGPLTEEQLEAIEADNYLTVEKVEEATEPTAVSEEAIEADTPGPKAKGKK